jgi:hypothetical protein
VTTRKGSELVDGWADRVIRAVGVGIGVFAFLLVPLINWSEFGLPGWLGLVIDPTLFFGFLWLVCKAADLDEDRHPLSGAEILRRPEKPEPPAPRPYRTSGVVSVLTRGAAQRSNCEVSSLVGLGGRRIPTPRRRPGSGTGMAMLGLSTSRRISTRSRLVSRPQEGGRAPVLGRPRLDRPRRPVEVRTTALVARGHLLGSPTQSRGK